MVPKEDQCCQLLSKFFDNMDYIVIINRCHTTQAQFFQVLATVCNKADYFPTLSLLKIKYFFLTLNKRVLTVVLITRHCK